MNCDDFDYILYCNPRYYNQNHRYTKKGSIDKPWYEYFLYESLFWKHKAKKLIKIKKERWKKLYYICG